MSLLERYAKAIAKHPVITLMIMLIVLGVSVYYSSTVKNVDMDYRSILPEGYDAIDAFTLLEDNFGGSETAMISVEIDPTHSSSDEARDIRDPDIMTYIDILTQMLEHTEDVIGVNSASTVLRSLNNETLPKSKREIIDLTIDDPLITQYISSDYTMSVIRINLADDYDSSQTAENIQEIIDQIDKPKGIMANVAGESMSDPIVTAQITPDMQKTSRISLIAILVILVLLLRSFKFAVGPLLTIGVGITLAMGYVGLIGMGMTPQTSGVISMIMGIGIDFGIQTVTRFRQELKKMVAEKAIVVTLSNVFVPMLTTTLAALIGFRAMALGELTMLADMGNIMSYGVAACFIAAVTMLPALLVLGERFKFKHIFGGK